MRPTVIIGAGGHAGCLRDLCHLRGREVRGFIDRTHPAGTRIDDVPILGGDALIADPDLLANCDFVLGIGAPAVRRAYGAAVLARGGRLATLIGPHAFVSPSARLGEGVVLMGQNAVNHHAQIDDFCALDWQATIGHDSHLYPSVFLAPGVHVGGHAEIGQDAYVGIGASVIDRRRIGAGTVVGAQAAVTRDLPDNVIAVGIPAAPIKTAPAPEVWLDLPDA